MRTVTAIAFAAVAGICLALFLFALNVGGVSWVVPAVALGLCASLLLSAFYMARRAGTPGCLPFGVFILATALILLLILTSGG